MKASCNSQCAWPRGLPQRPPIRKPMGRWLWHFTVRTESSASCHPKISKENSGQKASATVIMWLFCNCRPFSPGKSRPSFRNSSGLLHWIWEIILSYIINVVSPMINHSQLVVLYPRDPKIFGHWNGFWSGLPHCPLAWSSACHTQQSSAKSWHCEGLPADSKTCLHDFKPLRKVNTPRRNPKMLIGGVSNLTPLIPKNPQFHIMWLGSNHILFQAALHLFLARIFQLHDISWDIRQNQPHHAPSYCWQAMINNKHSVMTSIQIQIQMRIIDIDIVR